MITYTVKMVTSQPCGVIGCSCERGVRYVICSYKPTKALILKWEPGLERAEIEKKVNGQVTSVTAFKRLHAGTNGRRKDSFSNCFGVIR